LVDLERAVGAPLPRSADDSSTGAVGAQAIDGKPVDVAPKQEVR
jgi:hypothetical protein